MEKIILTDVDGVLLDWETAFYEWMKNKGYDAKNEGIYNMEAVFEMRQDKTKALIKEFNNSAWMAYLQPLRDARSGVAKLVEAGYTFYAITSISLDPNTKKLRQRNLDNVFGKDVFTKLVCLDTGADKDDALEEYKDSGLFWIEDKTMNANLGARLGLKSIIITHKHNRNDNELDSSIKRAGKWTEIVDIVVNC
jgi:hypothetical protein|tara:strand:- start:207 stop:788 length:582 start_codon:yes stop_codon:yes gene_type:complete